MSDQGLHGLLFYLHLHLVKAFLQGKPFTFEFKSVSSSYQVFKYFGIISYESHHEKTSFLHICENKGADQLHGNCTADQHLCFLTEQSSTF